MRYASKYFTRLSVIFLLFFMLSCAKQNQEGNTIENSLKAITESTEHSSANTKEISPENSSADSKEMNPGNSSVNPKEMSKDSVSTDKESLSEETTKPPLESLNENQVQAIQTAKDYLDTMHLSQTELLQMLSVENIDSEDAKFALEYLNIDWNQEARKKAKEYCKHKIGFSKEKLKAQLLFDHFTEEEADFAVSHINVNWIEQAEIVAKEYMEDGVISKEDLIDALMNEGFTKKEAEKASLRSFKKSK